MELLISKADKNHFIQQTKKTILKYKMIQEGDRVAVGLSGGKDSSTLLYILTTLQKHLPFSFEILPITLTMGFDNYDITPLKNYVSKLGLPLYIGDTNIGKVVFDIRNESNPCSLCANMRRGALYKKARELGCSKVALGHHLDDGIETFFMNFFYNNRIGTFQPKTYLSRSNITLIRPMIALEEDLIKCIVKTKGIPVINNPCPANRNTKREEIKQLISSLSKSYPNIRRSFLSAANSVNPIDFWNLQNFI